MPAIVHPPLDIQVGFRLIVDHMAQATQPSFGRFVMTDGRRVTGQHPGASKEVAQAPLTALRTNRQYGSRNNDENWRTGQAQRPGGIHDTFL